MSEAQARTLGFSDSPFPPEARSLEFSNPTLLPQARSLEFSNPPLPPEARSLEFSNPPLPPEARSRDRAHKDRDHKDRDHKNNAPLLAQAAIGEKLAQRFFQKHGTNHDYPRFSWQKSFHDHGIRGERDFENHFIYCTQNFAKHGLAANWKFTSLNFPELIDSLG